MHSSHLLALIKWPAGVTAGVRASLTCDELEELRSGGGVADLAPARALPVADLVAGDLSVLAAEGRRLPAEHDALQGGGRGMKHRVRNRVNGWRGRGEELHCRLQ